jgi:hypothetical protein
MKERNKLAVGRDKYYAIYNFVQFVSHEQFDPMLYDVEQDQVTGLWSVYSKRKLKRNLKEEERKRREEARKHESQVGLCFIAEAERVRDEGRTDASPRPSVNDVLIVSNFLPHWNTSPGAVGRYLYHALCCSPSVGAKMVRRCSELGKRLKEQGFVLKMKRALRDCKKQGQSIFVAVDVEAAEIKIHQPHIRFGELVSKLEERHPNFSWAMLERRVSRLFEPIPKEWNIKKRRRFRMR